MIVKKLILKEGIESNTEEFSERRNLIHSKSNSKGKSTYLRLMFYALGYPIPNMKGIDYKNISTEIDFVEKEKEYILYREGDLLQLLVGNETMTFTLPSEHLAFLSYIFQYQNIKVLNNLLGFIYVDQDKGWSLLNRGTVIGKIKFSIEELLSGLNNVDINTLLEQKRKHQLNKNKYAAMLNIQELSEQVYECNGEVFVSDIEKELMGKIAYINLKIENTKQALKELNSVILKGKQFFDYIDAMCLSVKKDDVVIPVNRETLVNSTANSEYLKARRSILITDIEKLKRERSTYEVRISDFEQKNMQISLFNDEAKDVIVNKQLALFNIDQSMVMQLSEDSKEELRQVNSSIKTTIKNQNQYITKIYDYVLKYAKALGVDDKMVYKDDYIFTSDLKSMSGAILQKMVFAFKIAFLKVIEEDMNTKLFMILDSPKGKELDDENTTLISNLIHEELSDNQVFIASIYDFASEKKIEIKERAIENREI